MKNEKSEISKIAIDLIDDPKYAIRTRANDDDLHSLADSIRDIGLIHPILVKSRKDRFEVISGHRRLVACKLLGLQFVSAIIVNVDNARCDAIKLHENLCREDVNPVDQARLIEKVMKEKKLTIEQLAKRLKRGKTFIHERLLLLRMDPIIRDAVENGKLGLRAAQWFSRIDDRLTRLHYVNAGISSGVSANLAYDWYRRWKEKGATMPPTKTEFKESEDEIKVEYYNTPCRICQGQIEMGKEEIIFVHPECLEAVEGVKTIEQPK